jgi:hypothetical protein
VPVTYPAHVALDLIILVKSSKEYRVYRSASRNVHSVVNWHYEQYVISTFLVLNHNRGKYTNNLTKITIKGSRSHWPRGLRCRSAAERFLGSWVRIPAGAWMFISCECFVLSRRGVCDRPIPRPECYRLWCVSECDQVKINNLDTCCE